MPEKKKLKILFVDDEPQILQGLERLLHFMRKEWEMKFVESGVEALSLLQKEGCQVIVTDMRMPGMDGVQLLSQVKNDFPEMIRIVLSGYSDKEMVLRAVPLAHQYLAKPCDPQILISAITRARALGDLLSDPTLIKLVTQSSTLPSLPALYLELEEMLQSESSSIDRVAEIVSQDLGMTAKVLQLANSAFFGLPRTITSPGEAVLFIGFKALEALILSVHIFSQFQNASRFTVFLDRLWHHSLTTAGISKAITQKEMQDKTGIEFAYIAGLLHDCGKLVLADNYPNRYEQALVLAEQEGLPLWQAEEKTFGAHHGSVGAYLLGIWGFPNPMVEALAFHHQPDSFPQEGFNIITAVHVADGLEKLGQASEGEEIDSFVDKGYLTKLGLLERLPEWRTLGEEVMKKGASHGKTDSLR